MKKTYLLVTFSIIFLFSLSGCELLQRQQSPQTFPAKKDENKKITVVPKNTVPPKQDDTEVQPDTPGKKFSEPIRPHPEDTLSQNTDNLAIIVSYFRFLNSLPEKAIAREHARTEKEFKEDGTPVNRLRLAMLLGLSKGSHRDTRQSLSLLAPYLEEPDQDPLLKDFSYLLFTLIQERQSEAKHHLELSDRLKKESGENEKLKKMIEELKTIEENIMKRDEAS